MKIYYWNIRPNFGDLINPWLWPKVFPDFRFETLPKTKKGVVDAGDAATLLVGIGTLLNDRFPKSGRSIVIGSGVGYGSAPKISEPSRIYCVRGPKSAEALSLPASMGIIDPGILLREYYSKADSRSHEFSFMPQISSVAKEQGCWRRICEDLGFGYIDPRDPVEKSAKAIAETGTLLTESMHGAIVAEALGVPWVPIVTRREILAFKWHDWCESVDVEYQPAFVSSITQPVSPTFRQKLKLSVSLPLAKRQLQHASKREPSQARDGVIDSRISQLKDVFAEVAKCESVQC
ncbi:Exopolysaccharide glucosyl ketal-pyruvate-transferase [Stieleria neptunia]|uniref:Exopolysaccharide glucosyl ketal-pyruvate-transferase n=1 Tax=Stieleria neptunia TaxID=2527979 RepID=A0A518HR15_9BACT|nr:polysaccharide pyruvyl transferase family protein [Stieleria neptunia]QDV43228.1 Exopolysaccharide glucosyl ketal-pyruvate-transferase [Stieleria neptunia]